VLEAFGQAAEHYYKKFAQEKQNAVGVGKSLPEVLHGISQRGAATAFAVAATTRANDSTANASRYSRHRLHSVN